MKKIQFLLVACLIFGVACGPTKYAQSRSAFAKLSLADKQLADSLIGLALDHEGLFTIFGNLKPISTVAHLRFAIAKDSNQTEGQAQIIKDIQVLEKLKRFQKVLGTLNFGDLRFVIIPFRATEKGKRSMEILVCRQDLTDSIVKKYASFFGQFGFVAGTPLETIVSVLEYENRFDRYRGYGYLFGYPNHAIDFFVMASQSEAKTKTFVSRDFVQIPVFAGTQGHFVYAVSKSHNPNLADSLVSNKAAIILEKYKNIRPAYLKGSRLQGYKLLVDKAGKKNIF